MAFKKGRRPTRSGSLFHNLRAEIETPRPLCQGSRTKPSGAATSKHSKTKRISCNAQAASGGRPEEEESGMKAQPPGAKHHHRPSSPNVGTLRSSRPQHRALVALAVNMSGYRRHSRKAITCSLEAISCSLEAITC